MSARDFDVVVIGAGVAGPSLAAVNLRDKASRVTDEL